MKLLCFLVRPGTFQHMCKLTIILSRWNCFNYKWAKFYVVLSLEWGRCVNVLCIFLSPNDGRVTIEIRFVYGIWKIRAWFLFCIFLRQLCILTFRMFPVVLLRWFLKSPGYVVENVRFCLVIKSSLSLDDNRKLSFNRIGI